MKSKIMEFVKGNKVVTLGSIFIAVVLVIIISMVSRSYALDGFGIVELECDKILVSGEDTITCNLTGTVADTASVSGVNANIVLSENLTLESVTIDSSIWGFGNGDDGNIAIATDTNKSGTFDIATFVIKSSSASYNVVNNISIQDVYFYEDASADFEEQSIASISLDIKTPLFSSDVYDVDNDYILVENKNISDIIANFETENCNAFVYNDTTKLTAGTINEISVLKILNGSTVLKEFDIVYMESDVYDLSNNYIISSVNELVDIIDDIDVYNGSLSIKNGELVLSYDSTGIKSYEVLNISSDKYLIDLDNNTLVIDNEVSDDILNNITTTDNISVSIDNDELVITYNESELKRLSIVTLYSDEYDIDLSNGYIYGSDTIEESNITSSGDINITDNKLSILKDGNTVSSLDIVSISSDKYIINDAESYIYTINTNNLEEINKNVEVVNGELSLSDNKLVLKYNDITVKEYDLYYISSSYSLSDNSVFIENAVSITEFISKFNLNGLSYKIYDASDAEITSGNVDANYKLKIYKGSTLLDTYTIIKEYLNITNLSIKDDSIIYNVKLNTTYEDLLKNISTSGSIKLLDKKGEELELDDVVESNSTIKITLTSKTVEYKISVLGDVASDGKLNPGDIAKLYQKIQRVEGIEFTEIDILSGDINHDETISISDVSKLYAFMRNKEGVTLD